MSDIIFGKETLFILDEDLNVNKSDLLFKKPKVDLNSTSLLENEQNLNKISIKNNYKRYCINTAYNYLRRERKKK